MSYPKPGPGRVSVLLVLDRHPLLVESALAAHAARAPQTDLRSLAMPTQTTIDRTFPAVPMGPAQSGTMSAAAFHPDASETFAVRAFVDADHHSNVPHRVDGRRLYSDPMIQSFLTCRGDPPVGTAADVKTKLKAPELSTAGLDGKGVAIAIVDFGINLEHLKAKLGFLPPLDAEHSWTPDGVSTKPGEHPVGHGTKCAFGALIAAPKATLLDYAVLLAGATASVSAGTISVALKAYSKLHAALPTLLAPGKFKGVVVSNSWGLFHPDDDFVNGHPGRYIDNPDHPFNKKVAAMAHAGADIVFAAGNCGAQCPNPNCQGRVTGSIMGANASPAVLTVAGCDIRDQRVGYSSQGPGIAHMAHDKPDLTAYTHYLGSGIPKPDAPDDGTSTACPVAAGCVAALRTKLPPSQTSPAKLFLQLTATARQIEGAASWNADVGHGIIDAPKAAHALGLM
jgi:Subtilase family